MFTLYTLAKTALLQDMGNELDSVRQLNGRLRERCGVSSI